MADLDILKDIPGYKAILKSVLKTQIQLLVEQLSDHTGEESIILTASVNDGSLSHLGSCTGKGFLEGRDEIKSQFLGYCLKSHHRKKSQETTPQSPYERSGGPPPRSSPSIPGPRMAVHQSPAQPAKRPRIHPVSMARVSAPGPRGSPSAAGDQTFGASRNIPHGTEHGLGMDANGHSVAKVEVPDDSQGGDNSFIDSISSTPTSFPSTLQLNRTQSATDMAGDSDQKVAQKDESNESSGEGELSSGSNIKVEPITEGEMELEITGVELGDGSQGPAENWGQDVAPGAHLYGTPGADGGPDLDSSTDQSGYNFETLTTPSQKRPRFVMNLFQKIELLNLLEAEPYLSQRQLSKKYGVGKSTVAELLRNRDAYKREWESGGNLFKKRLGRTCKFGDINELTLQWYHQQLMAGTPVSGAGFCRKAASIAESLGILGFKASNGWLDSLKSRHNITFTKNIAAVEKQHDMLETELDNKLTKNIETVKTEHDIENELDVTVKNLLAVEEQPNESF